jgi:chorismate mutase
MSLVCRGIRGATTAEANTKEAIVEATLELLSELVQANSIDLEMVAAAFLTTTQDLNAEFPAVAARKAGWNKIALLCGHEMVVPDSMQRCIRVLILLNTEKKSSEMVNLYLRNAKNLRSHGVD